MCVCVTDSLKRKCNLGHRVIGLEVKVSWVSFQPKQTIPPLWNAWRLWLFLLSIITLLKQCQVRTIKPSIPPPCTCCRDDDISVCREVWQEHPTPLHHWPTATGWTGFKGDFVIGWLVTMQVCHIYDDWLVDHGKSVLKSQHSLMHWFNEEHWDSWTCSDKLCKLSCKDLTCD